LFYNADQKTKNRLRRDLHFTNYSSTDGDVLDELYRYIYHEKLVGRQRVQVLRCADILRVDDLGKRVRLSFVRPEGGGVETAEVDLVVLGTGFRDVGTAENQERFPPIFQPLEPFARLREDGCIQINYDYSVEMADEIEPSMPCFVNGLCESSHGMGDAGSFSLLSLRAKTILDSLTSRLRARSRAKVSTSIAGCHAREFLMTEKGER
jgi:L-ornithine N5-oxygenase